jgi:MYXO-CTERM domain-containing protein
MEEIETTIELAGPCEPGVDAGRDGGDPDAGDGDGGCCTIAPGARSGREALAMAGVLVVVLSAAVRRRRRA